MATQKRSKSKVVPITDAMLQSWQQEEPRVIEGSCFKPLPGTLVEVAKSAPKAPPEATADDTADDNADAGPPNPDQA